MNRLNRDRKYKKNNEKILNGLYEKCIEQNIMMLLLKEGVLFLVFIKDVIT